MHRFAVILAHNRPELLHETWQAIGPQVDMVIIIDNASDPPVNYQEFHSLEWFTDVMTIPDQPPNLSKLWALGIDHAMLLLVPHLAAGWQQQAEPPFIAVLCDDAPPPPGWFEAVTQAMIATGAPVGCSAPEPFGWGGPPRVKTAPDSDLTGRLCGWAWILDPISPVRPDPRFEWWWGDSSVDWDARAAGGMVMIGSHPVPNHRPNDFTARADLMAQSGKDGERFAEKYGSRPWL